MIAKRVLMKDASLRIQLTHYRAGLEQAAHVHDYHQLSFLLSGSMAERHGGQTQDLLRPFVGRKPIGMDHSDVFGRYGALILSVNFSHHIDLSTWDEAFSDWTWHGLRSSPRQVLAQARLCQVEPYKDEALTDLMALGALGEVPHKCVPKWLERVREAIWQDERGETLDALAFEAGVHRVHLSRRFTHHFGLSPSQYRHYVRASKAAPGLMTGERASEVAYAAGFTDQSHMCRVLKTHWGLTPRQLSHLAL